MNERNVAALTSLLWSIHWGKPELAPIRATAELLAARGVLVPSILLTGSAMHDELVSAPERIAKGEDIT